MTEKYMLSISSDDKEVITDLLSFSRTKIVDEWREISLEAMNDETQRLIDLNEV